MEANTPVDLTSDEVWEDMELGLDQEFVIRRFLSQARCESVANEGHAESVPGRVENSARGCAEHTDAPEDISVQGA